MPSVRGALRAHPAIKDSIANGISFRCKPSSLYANHFVVLPPIAQSHDRSQSTARNNVDAADTASRYLVRTFVAYAMAQLSVVFVYSQGQCALRPSLGPSSRWVIQPHLGSGLSQSTRFGAVFVGGVASSSLRVSDSVWYIAHDSVRYYCHWWS